MKITKKVLGLFVFCGIVFASSLWAASSASVNFSANNNNTIWSLPKSLYNLSTFYIDVAPKGSQSSFKIGPFTTSDAGKNVTLKNVVIPSGYEATINGQTVNLPKSDLNLPPEKNTTLSDNKEVIEKVGLSDCAKFSIECLAQGSKKTTGKLDVVFLLDISGTMYDSGRIGNAVLAIKGALNTFKKYNTEKNIGAALITFGVEGVIRPTSQIPPIFDYSDSYSIVNRALSDFNLSAGQRITNIGDGILQAKNLFTKAQVGSRKVLVLLTDGVPNASTKTSGCVKDISSQSKYGRKICECPDSESYPTKTNACVSDAISQANSFSGELFTIAYGLPELQAMEGKKDARGVLVPAGAAKQAKATIDAMKGDKQFEQNNDFANEINNVVASLIKTEVVPGNCNNLKAQIVLKDGIKFSKSATGMSDLKFDESSNTLSWSETSAPSGKIFNFGFGLTGQWTGSGDLSKVAKSFTYSHSASNGTQTIKGIVATASECNDKKKKLPSAKIVVESSVSNDCSKGEVITKVSCELDGNPSDYQEEDIKALKCDNVTLTFRNTNSAITANVTNFESFNLAYKESKSISIGVSVLASHQDIITGKVIVTATWEQKEVPDPNPKNITFERCSAGLNMAVNTNDSCEKGQINVELKCLSDFNVACTGYSLELEKSDGTSPEIKIVKPEVFGTINANETKKLTFDLIPNNTAGELTFAGNVILRENGAEKRRQAVSVKLPNCCYEGNVSVVCDAKGSSKPLNLILVLDRSLSMTNDMRVGGRRDGGYILDTEKSLYKAKEAMKTLMNSDAIDFNRDIVHAISFSDGVDETFTRIQKNSTFFDSVMTFGHGSTNLYEALYRVEKSGLFKSGYVNVVMLMTDGLPTFYTGMKYSRDDGWTGKEKADPNTCDLYYQPTSGNFVLSEYISTVLSPSCENKPYWRCNSCFNLPTGPASAIRNNQYKPHIFTFAINTSHQYLEYYFKQESDKIRTVDVIRSMLSTISSNNRVNDYETTPIQQIAQKMKELIDVTKEPGRCNGVAIVGNVQNHNRINYCSKECKQDVSNGVTKITVPIGILEANKSETVKFKILAHGTMPTIFGWTKIINGQNVEFSPQPQLTRCSQ